MSLARKGLSRTFTGAGLLIAFLLGVVCFQAAAAKGRNRWVWGIVGFFLPIVGLLFVALLPRIREDTA